MGWLRLTRPANSLGATALLLLGAGSPNEWSVTTLWAAFSLWAITVFGYVTNDLHDVPADRVNKPHRPIVSGLIHPSVAGKVAYLLGSIALVAAAQVVWWGVAAAFGAMAALWGYSTWAKRRPLLGNVLIGVLAGSALLAGGWLRGEMVLLFGPAVMVATFITGREILKTAEDIPGDKIAGTRTVATQWGMAAAIKLYLVCLGLTVVLAVGLWPEHSPQALFARGVWVGYLVALGLLCGRSPLPQAVRRGLRGTKVGYGVGLAALALTLSS